MAKEIKDVQMSVRVTSYEYFALSEIATEHNVSLSELLRACTLTDFVDRQITINFDDIFEFCNKTGKINSDIDQIIIAINKNGQMYINEISKIRMVLSDIKNEKSIIYKKIEKTRTKISQYLCKSIKKNKETFYDRIIAKSTDIKEKKIQVRLTESQLKILQQEAEFEECSISDLLKNNVFKKCVDKRITISSYPMDELNRSIQKRIDILNAITKDIQNRIIKENDIRNTIKILEQIYTSLKIFNESILTEQKDIRREVNKILAERRKEHGYYKNNSNKKLKGN